MGKNRNVRTGYQEIRYRMIIDSPSPQASIDKLRSLIEERCPVSNTLCGVKVSKIAP